MSTLPLVVLLIGVMLITMLTRVFLPMGQKIEGTEIRKIILSFQYRLLYHRISIYMIGVVMVLGGLGQWLSFALQVVLALGAFAIVTIPIKYTFTSSGVALNNVVVRHWEEFGSFEETRRGIRLKTINAKERGFNLLLPEIEKAEVSRMVGKLLKGVDLQARSGSESSFKIVSRPAKKARRVG